MTTWDEMTTWEKELRKACEETGDRYADLVSTMSAEELCAEFDPGCGWMEGVSFTAWGEAYVYFPVTYDGSEWVGYAPRNPCDIATDHQGG